jgi:hypothetical protein
MAGHGVLLKAEPSYRYRVPVRVQARLARVASGEAGAMIVSTSPAMKVVAAAIVKPAVAAPAAKTIVPTAVPLCWIEKVTVAVAAVPAVP